jgi:hypothetical protein
MGELFNSQKEEGSQYTYVNCTYWQIRPKLVPQTTFSMHNIFVKAYDVCMGTFDFNPNPHCLGILNTFFVKMIKVLDGLSKIFF